MRTYLEIGKAARRGGSESTRNNGTRIRTRAGRSHCWFDLLLAPLLLPLSATAPSSESFVRSVLALVYPADDRHGGARRRLLILLALLSCPTTSAFLEEDVILGGTARDATSAKQGVGRGVNASARRDGGSGIHERLIMQT
jgi:hypothetical protein